MEVKEIRPLVSKRPFRPIIFSITYQKTSKPSKRVRPAASRKR